jgi:hypothetical protein
VHKPVTHQVGTGCPLCRRSRRHSGLLVTAYVLAQVTVIVAVGAHKTQAQSLRIAGDEFLVNARTIASQNEPAVVPDAGGGFVVVWHGPKGAMPDDIERRVWLRRTTLHAALGSEIQVNTNVGISNNILADVAVSNVGALAVVWQNNYGLDGSYAGIFGQRYDPDLSPRGTEFQVNTYTTLRQIDPAIAPLSGGGFVVVWHDAGDSSLSYRSDIRGQIVGADGALRGSELLLAEGPTGSPREPKVAALPNDRFVVVWNQNERDGDVDGIFGQIFHMSGEPLIEVFQVNDITSSRQFWPDVASCDSGEFVVVWEGYYGKGYASAISARRFDASGDPIGREFVVNSQTSSGELKAHPIVTMTPQCDAVASWRNLIQGPSEHADVVVRRLSDDPESEADIRINTFEGNPITDFDLEAEMSADRCGHIMVVWPSREDGDATGIIARPMCLDDPKYLACGNATCVGDSGTDSNVATASDALAVLRGAVGLATCYLCLCDTNGSGAVEATDALIVLRRSLGYETEFACPTCPADTSVAVSVGPE